MSNSHSPEWYRRVYRDVSISGIVATGTAGVSNAILCPTGHTIFVQKITVNVKTLGAQTITVQDDSATNAALFIEASAAAGTIRTIDYGAKGFALTAGENLDIVGTAAPAYSYAIDAYAKQTSTGQSTTIARTF